MSARENARAVRAVEAASRRVRHWAGNARTVRGLARVAARLDRLAAPVAAAGESLGRWTRTSWLLGPPAEPEVVVIDLRETHTVGPVIALLDRVAAAVGPRWRESSPRRWLRAAGAATAAAPLQVAGGCLLAAVLGAALAAVATGDAPTGWHLVGAGLALAATRERRSADELRETALGRALAALLVPPEPPNAE